MALFGAASSPKNVVAGARFRLIVRLCFHFRTLNAAGLARRRSPAPVVRGTRSRPVNGGRLCETEAHWHRRDIPCGDTKELGIAAPDLPVRCAPGDHAISWAEFVDIRPSSLHDARGIQTGDEWKVDLSIPIARACAVACACFGVGWIDPCIADPDQNLAILWLRDRQVPQAHDIWITVAVKNHGAHRQYHLHPV